MNSIVILIADAVLLILFTIYLNTYYQIIIVVRWLCKQLIYYLHEGLFALINLLGEKSKKKKKQ